VALADWFLTADERDNPATRLDSRHPDGVAWSAGNEVRPLVHGAVYFAALKAAVDRMVPGDLVLFADWRGDPDERLTGEPGSEVAQVLTAAAARGVDVRGLVWRSHLDRFQFSEAENRHLGEDINAVGGDCLLDMRVRTGGSHHQKFVVLRHPGRPDQDVAFVGGIDLCHSRRDDAGHRGDPQRQPMAAVYGPRPPWHDVQLALRGPAVGDVETVFRERWEDPQPLSRNPLHRIADLLRGDDRVHRPLPPPLPDPPPAGSHTVQLLRTYPRRLGGYPFAPRGERSVARGYLRRSAGRAS
jgi:phosphatidylserine/phosphatidylglycerophosphate/cardiolipin synthase-like enzyme